MLQPRLLQHPKLGATRADIRADTRADTHADTRPSHHKRRLWPLPTLALLALLGACASTPAPQAEMAVAEAAVANATQAGALQWAPAEMRSAQDKLARAQAAVTAKDNGQALTLAHEARADAQVAAAAARAAQSERAAQEVLEANRVLREEMNRKAGASGTPAMRMP